MVARQDDKFPAEESPISTPRTDKRRGNGNTIRSQLLSLRKHKKEECGYTNIAMDNFLGEYFPRSDAAFTVEVLKKQIRAKLLPPIRLLRTADFQYINVEEDNLADVYFVNDVEKNYAFLWAAFTGNIELLHKLHQQGADVNFIYPGEHLNALHLSALCGSVECTRWLLKEGCQIVCTSDHLSPLHFAVLGNSQRICRYLIESGCRIDLTALHVAVQANSLDCVAYLLELQVPVNGYDEAGMTPLHIASDIGNAHILQLLLHDKRIDVNVKTKTKKYTALHLAAENGYYICLKVLLEKGAYVDELSGKKQSPLYLACKETFLDCVELLLEYGAAVNVQDNEKRTPLHAAVSKTLDPLQIHIVRHLVDRQADVHLADDFGYTALHIAALNELDECVEYLIMNGANVAAKTEGNVTALNIINRKTPISSSKIYERLNLSLAYNQEQFLKFSFRDIIRNSTVGEIGYLYTLQKEGQAKVLEHPLCEAFLHLKWQKVRIFILLRVGISLVIVTLLSLLISWGITEPECYKELLVPILGVCSHYLVSAGNATANTSTQTQCWNTILNPSQPLTLTYNISECIQKACKNRNITLSTSVNPNSSTPNPAWLITLSCNDTKVYKTSDEIICSVDRGFLNKFFTNYSFILCSMWIMIMIMLVVNTIRIIFTFAAYKSAKHFFSKYSNIIEVLVTVGLPLSLINMCRLKTKGDDLEKFNFLQKSFASLTILCSWAYVMIMVSQLPSIGTYVAMFNKVLKEFLKMIIAFLCLLMGFTFTFCILKTDQFKNPVVGFAKIMAMMTGELNFNDLIMENNDDKEDDDSHHKPVGLYTTVFVIAIFMIIITIVLMNLLVGIAVNDVEGLRKNADLCKLIQQTKLIHFLEKTCFKGFFPPYIMDILQKLLYTWPDSYTVVIYVRPLSPHEKRLPRDVMEAGLKIALDRLKKKRSNESSKSKKPNMEERIYALEEQILKLQKLICSLQGTIENSMLTNNNKYSNSNSFDEVTDCDNEGTKIETTDLHQHYRI